MIIANTSIINAEEYRVPERLSVPTDQVRGSLERLQTFENQAPKELRNLDHQRDKQLQRLLPNFRVLKDGTSDRELKSQAQQRLLRMRLTNFGAQKTREILDDMSLYRRLPEVRFEIDPETYDYFIGNPDVVVGLWQAMGITAVDLKQKANYQFTLDHVDGTHSDVMFLKRNQNVNIVYCQGQFQSPFLKRPITANGLLCINAKFEKRPDGTTFVRHHADVFVSFPNAAVEATAKLISPISNYIADRNFQEISLFMHSMSLSMQRQPEWVEGLSNKIEHVSSDRITQLHELTAQVHQAERERIAQQFQSDQRYLQRR